MHVHIHIPHRSREAWLGQHRALGEWQKLFLFTRLRRQDSEGRTAPSWEEETREGSEGWVVSRTC